MHRRNLRKKRKPIHTRSTQHWVSSFPICPVDCIVFASLCYLPIVNDLIGWKLHDQHPARSSIHPLLALSFCREKNTHCHHLPYSNSLVCVLCRIVFTVCMIQWCLLWRNFMFILYTFLHVDVSLLLGRTCHDWHGILVHHTLCYTLYLMKEKW